MRLTVPPSTSQDAVSQTVKRSATVAVPPYYRPALAIRLSKVFCEGEGARCIMPIRLYDYLSERHCPTVLLCPTLHLLTSLSQMLTSLSLARYIRVPRGPGETFDRMGYRATTPLASFGPVRYSAQYNPNRRKGRSHTWTIIWDLPALGD